MSGTSSSPDSDVNNLIKDTVLEEQMDICDEIIKEIMNPDDRLDVSDEENVFTKTQHKYDKAKKRTERILADRDESAGLNRAFKQLIEGMIEERGFLDKLARAGGYDDDLKTATWWFKLYATVVLDIQREPVEYPIISHEFALIEFKKYRDEVIEHLGDSGIPPAVDRPDPSLLGFLTLSWAAIEDILRMWGEILTIEERDPEQISTRESILEGDSPKHGFIHNRQNYECFVTTYPEGQGGQDTYFNLKSAQYFPSEGDIVRLKDYQAYKKNGDPHGNLTAEWARRYDLD